MTFYDTRGIRTFHHTCAAISRIFLESQNHTYLFLRRDTIIITVPALFSISFFSAIYEFSWFLASVRPRVLTTRVNSAFEKLSRCSRHSLLLVPIESIKKNCRPLMCWHLFYFAISRKEHDICDLKILIAQLNLFLLLFSFFLLKRKILFLIGKNF